MTEQPGHAHAPDWRLDLSARPCPDCGPQGQRGEKGDRGERGESASRLPAKQARAVVYLFFFSVLVSLVCLAGLVYYSQALSAQQRAVTREQHAVTSTQREFLAAQKAGARETCDTIASIIAIPAVPGTSFARFGAVERHRYRELGCSP